MSGPTAASKARNSYSVSPIPAADRKLVSSLKEVVPHCEEEIYAMLKECHKDPDETVQRLLSQGNFHVVKRKRDKKKMSVKDASEAQPDSVSNSRKSNGNAGNRGNGRGVSLTRGRVQAGKPNSISSKSSHSRDNELISDARDRSVVAENGTQLYLHRAQTKNSTINNLENLLSSESSCGKLQAAPSLGPSLGSVSAPTLQGAWLGTGHGTIADMLKSKVLTGTSSASIVSSAGPSNTILEPHSVVNTCVASPGTVSPLSITENSLKPEYFKGKYNLSFVNDSEIEIPESISASMPPNRQAIKSFAFEEQEPDFVSVEDLDAPTAVLGNDFMTHARQDGQLLVVENVMENSSEVVEGVHYDDTSSLEGEAPSSAESSSVVSANLQRLSMREIGPVIIPDHIRVPEADYTTLSFGSFESGFGLLQSDFTEEQKTASFERCEDTAENNLTTANISTESSSSNMNQSMVSNEERQQNHKPCQGSNAFDNEVDVKRDEPSEQTQPQYVGSLKYPSTSSASPDHASQHPHVRVEASIQDIDTILRQPYDISNHYNGMIRTAPDIDARCSALLQLTTSKLEGNKPVGTMENVFIQEVGNANSFSGTSSIGHQTMQMMTVAHSSVSQSQQSVTTYATQQSGLPMGPYANAMGYQCVPPGFSRLQSPYQQNYVGTNNYQVPSPVAAAMKYPFPQYKVGAMHSTTSGNFGYGDYATTQPKAYAANPSVSTGIAPSFEEAALRNFKETNVIRQMEGSPVWRQSQLVWDLQDSSYYNVLGQNQQARYSESQTMLPLAHPSNHPDLFSNLYHQQQSGSSLITNRLLQHSSIGPIGALAAQVGSYQQSRKPQQTWANGF